MNERVTSTDELRSWTDKIPLRYEYTAGVAGERFLQGLRKGVVLAGRCAQCGKRYVPPKSYCIYCFKPIDIFEPVGSRGTVVALTASWVDFRGIKRQTPSIFAFVSFKGAEGGIVQIAEGRSLRIGSAVEPFFLPEARRTGAISDIEKFVAL